MVSHPAQKHFVLTLSWSSAPPKHEWSEGGLHVSGKEDWISKGEAHQGLIQYLSEHQRTELEEFTKFHRGRGETADTGGFTPRTVALIRLTAPGMFGKCVFAPVFAANRLTGNPPPPQTTVNIMPGIQFGDCQPRLRSPQGSWLCHSASQQLGTSGSLALLGWKWHGWLFPGQGSRVLHSSPRAGIALGPLPHTWLGHTHPPRKHREHKKLS